MHARTGRATGRFSKDSRVTWFQFTRARGARHVGGVALRTLLKFQFTRARGARPSYWCSCTTG